MTSQIVEKQASVEEAKLDIHRTIVLWLFCATFVCALILAALLYHSYDKQQEVISIMPVVILAGVLGSFVSALKRIYSAKDIFPIEQYSELFKNANVYLIAYSSIPPLIGAISAAVLYVIFAGQIITGPFFPTFDCETGKSCEGFLNFVSNWSPNGSEQYAKAIVWGFIAGFSERFVPDILNRISTTDINE